jgi:hypothetical protein
MLVVNAPSGFTGHLIQCYVNGASGTSGGVFFVDNQGFLYCSSSIYCYGNIHLAAHGYLSSSTDGIWAIENNAGTGFTRLQFGGTTSSFPSLGVSGSGLVAQLADGSANTTLTASTLTETTGVQAGSTGTPVKVVKWDPGLSLQALRRSLMQLS